MGPTIQGRIISSNRPTRRAGGPIYCEIKRKGIPGYGIPNPGDCAEYRNRLSKNEQGKWHTVEIGERRKPWWKYQIPVASSFSGYLGKVHSKINSLSLMPEYGSPPPGGRGGGGWGGGGWGGQGGGGSGGDPMKGFTYLFAFAIFGSGLSAYLRKSSTTSLFGATGVAVLLLISASLMGHPTYKVGTLLSLATCLALAGAMGLRAKNSV
eukprot:jgi/Picre1/35899/NNA_003357.t1